ncbi:MAG: carbohydrate kinase family protein [Anaerolineales bacterium]
MSTKEVVLTGSVAYDYLMHFPGRFREHILPDHLDSLSLSFLVDSLERRPGGIAANIAYSMALLGERPRVMATVGEDFEEYRRSLESIGVVTDDVKVIPGLLTASSFVTTDETDAQIASFYTGAMAHATELRFADLDSRPDLVLISPNDPEAMTAYADECIELGIRFFYDPSQQILRLDAAALEAGIQGCEALFANDYELALIEDKTSFSIDDITELTKFTVITRGEEGSDLYTQEGRQRIPAVPPIETAEPTGVGDSYRAGFLKGFLRDMPLDCCCMMGALTATYSLEHLGPQSHRFELDEFVTRFRSVFDSSCDLEQLMH